MFFDTLCVHKTSWFVLVKLKFYITIVSLLYQLLYCPMHRRQFVLITGYCGAMSQRLRCYQTVPIYQLPEQVFYASHHQKSSSAQAKLSQKQGKILIYPIQNKQHSCRNLQHMAEKKERKLWLSCSKIKSKRPIILSVSLGIYLPNKI